MKQPNYENACQCSKVQAKTVNRTLRDGGQTGRVK